MQKRIIAFLCLLQDSYFDTEKEEGPSKKIGVVCYKSLMVQGN